MTALQFLPALLLLFLLILSLIHLRNARKTLNRLTRVNERLRADNAALRAHFEEFPRSYDY